MGLYILSCAVYFLTATEIHQLKSSLVPNSNFYAANLFKPTYNHAPMMGRDMF